MIAGVGMGSRTDVATNVVLRDLDGSNVVWVELSGGQHHGSITSAGGSTISEAIDLAADLGIPVALVIDSSGSDVFEGLAALHAWGLIARSLTRASGVVPTIIGVTGACVSGPALLLGLADLVVMTETAFAFVTGPQAVTEFTGIQTDRHGLGGASIHDTSSGLAAIVVSGPVAVAGAIETLLSYLPSNSLSDPPVSDTHDPKDRLCDRAATSIPSAPTGGFDVRHVIEDVVDEHSFVEIRASYAPNVVTGFGRLDSRSVGIVANQPQNRAGTLDIEASRKAARFVSLCDAFNLPIVTLVDTPGFEPGKDLEWRGMIRHGAELAHAYCEATVPRICVIMRKSFGGAYIVMDSRGVGNDLCFAWPCAEIAVMGAAGAMQILRSDSTTKVDYEEDFLNPYRAAERGYVDAVIHPSETRIALCSGLSQLQMKRSLGRPRKHSNSPM